LNDYKIYRRQNLVEFKILEDILEVFFLLFSSISKPIFRSFLGKNLATISHEKKTGLSTKMKYFWHKHTL